MRPDVHENNALRASFRARRKSCPAASTARSAPSRRSARRRCSSAARRGARIEDVDGNGFIDYVMSWGPLIHGHAPRGLVKALRRGARDGTSFGAPSPLEVELGERVRQLMPSIERVRFVSSGTEATMSAIRVARAATGRERIVKFEGCYHGHADAFLVKAGSGALTLGVPTSPGVTRAAAADTLVAELQRSRVGRSGCSTPIAARSPRVIVEPIAGNMGVVPPADGFLRGAARDLHRARRAADLRRGDLGIPRRAGRRAAAGRRRARSDLPRQDHRRRPAGGRLRRPRRSDGAGVAGGAGLSGRHALGQSAGDDRRPLVPRPADAGAVPRSSRSSGTRLAAGLADAAREAGVPLQVNAVGSVLTPFFTDRPVRDYRSATSAEHRPLRAVFPRDARARRLSAAVAVRGVVPVGGAHGEGRGQDDRRRARRCGVKERE